MTSLVLYTALIVAAPTQTPLSYKEAHAESTASKRPLLVLVGADWCPACRDLKYSTLARLQRDGKLAQVVYAIVDVDREPELAGQLMRSSSIPQLILYTPAADGWYRSDLQGAQHATRVLDLIERGLALQRHDSAGTEAE